MRTPLDFLGYLGRTCNVTNAYPTSQITLTESSTSYRSCMRISRLLFTKPHHSLRLALMELFLIQRLIFSKIRNVQFSC